MVTRQDLLEFFDKRCREGRSIALKELIDEFDLSPEAAGDHLKRLWRDRLVEAVGFRPRRFHFRLQPGERLQVLRFRLAPRGPARLRWYRKKQEKERWPF